MAALATVGSLVRVTPWDELQYWSDPESEWEFVDDRRPFVFRVEGWLEDGHIQYGLYGPVVDGPERYHGLMCSIVTREDGSDWRFESSGSAGFKVGPNVAVRNHYHDFRHPEGTVVTGYPRMSRFGGVEVIPSVSDTELGDTQTKSHN
jgi:hypothetical protein